MMVKHSTINIKIKAHVDNLTITDIYDLLLHYRTNDCKDRNDCIINYGGMKFRIQVKVALYIEYIITEIIE